MNQKALFSDMSGAEFSECRTWRYALWRIWDARLGCVAFIGLNPSTADETEDDPTLRRCIDFAQRWEMGGVYMLNLFAYRATDPKYMKAADDPIGPQNDELLAYYVRNRCQRRIAAWGVHGAFRGRDFAVTDPAILGRNLECLGHTKFGHPRHPLYVPAWQEPVEWKQRDPD